MIEGADVAMRFPVDVTHQKRCPVCKTDGPGRNPTATPRPESACLTFAVYATTGRAANSVVLGGDLFFGWDAGVCSSPKSLNSLGAAVRVLRAVAPRPHEGMMGVQFCSTDCMRQFLNAAVDELERRARAIEPKVRTARGRNPPRSVS